jgi:hypothetical protein
MKIHREFGRIIRLDLERNPFFTQDGLLPVERIRRIDGTLEFAVANQETWSARCEPNQPDPPVHSDAPGLWETTPTRFMPACDSLTHFLITLCLQEAVMSSPHLTSLSEDESLQKLFGQPFLPLWLNGYSVFAEPSHHFHLSADRQLLAMNFAGLWVASPFHPFSDVTTAGVVLEDMNDRRSRTSPPSTTPLGLRLRKWLASLFRRR